MMRHAYQATAKRTLVAMVGAATYIACGLGDPLVRDNGAIIAVDTTTPPADEGHVMLCDIDVDLERTIIVHEGDHEPFLAHGGHLGPCAPDPSCDDHAHAWKMNRMKPHKVAICHIPPGNPSNAHTIIVSVNAVPAHLAHGDLLGFCSRPDCEPDPDADGEDPAQDAPMVDDDGDETAPSDSGTIVPLPSPETCPDGIAACDANGGCAGDLTCIDGCCLALEIY